MEENQKEKHFFELLHQFKFGMMTTRAVDGEMHARPMAIAKVADQADVWFVSDVHSEKVEELTKDAHVSIAMQAGQKFLALAGKGEVVRDREMLRSLWNEGWRVWFPDGVEDKNLVLLKIKPTHGEYWDNEGVNRVSFLYQAAKAYVTGQTMGKDQGLQGKVELQH